MTKENILTVRWNNWLSLWFGIPILIYIVVVLPTSVLSDFAGFIGMVILGILYWGVVEGHAAMRFAWLRKNSANNVSVKQGFSQPQVYIRMAFNATFWIALLFPFIGIIDYGTGLLAFLVVTIMRLVANIYRINVIRPEQADNFPLRGSSYLLWFFTELPLVKRSFFIDALNWFLFKYWQPPEKVYNKAPTCK